jgi:hypothetical protein
LRHSFIYRSAEPLKRRNGGKHAAVYIISDAGDGQARHRRTENPIHTPDGKRARAVAEAAEKAATNKKATVFCGSGNNGGDGIAASRILRYKGFETRTLLSGAKRK